MSVAQLPNGQPSNSRRPPRDVKVKGHGHSHISRPVNGGVDSHQHGSAPASASPHHHHGLAVRDGHCVGASLRGLIVIVALSLHEILEGLAVGLQRDSSGVWQLFAAVAAHKYVISFCVGLELATTGVAMLIHCVYILVFSLVTPIGKTTTPAEDLHIG